MHVMNWYVKTVEKHLTRFIQQSISWYELNMSINNRIIIRIRVQNILQYTRDENGFRVFTL